jgi:hypothetical protein
MGRGGAVVTVKELAQKLVEMTARGFGDEPVVWVDRSRDDVMWVAEEFTTIELTSVGVELDLY